MTAVTVGAGCSSAISIRHSASMHALPVRVPRDGRMECCAAPEIADCCDRRRKYPGCFFLATGEAGSLEVCTWWMGPWQEMQLGASGSWEAAAFPWMLCLNSLTSSAWHCAHFPASTARPRTLREHRRGRIGKRCRREHYARCWVRAKLRRRGK